MTRSERLVLRLHDGRSASIDCDAARGVADRLWELGLTVGAGAAAARIADVLRHPHGLGVEVDFEPRELAAVVAASGAIEWRPAPAARGRR